MRFVITIFLFFLYQLAFSQFKFDVKLANDKVSYALGESVTLDIIIPEEYAKDIIGRPMTVETFEEGKTDVSKEEHLIKKTRFKLTVSGAVTAQVRRVKLSILLDGKKFEKQVGVAFGEKGIESVAYRPVDFNDFWDNELEQLKKTPLDAKMKLVSELSSDSIDVYYINYQVDGSGSRFYGVLNIPKFLPKGEKLPALVFYPGAGVRGYGPETRFAKSGIISLHVGVHGVPINLPNDTYQALANGALNGYQFYNIQSKESYYFNRVIKGAIRALDFIEQLEMYDGQNLVVNGSSQGGALSLIVTALDKRVKAVAAYCPAMCQTNGSLFGKAEGWPKPMTRFKIGSNDYLKDVEETVGYYDVANFVEKINVPVFMTWGLIDDVTPGSTIFGAYNKISSDKKMFVLPHIAHANDKRQIDQVYSFLVDQVDGEDN